MVYDISAGYQTLYEGMQVSAVSYGSRVMVSGKTEKSTPSTAVRDIFYDIKREMNIFSGILIIFLGLYFLGILKIPILNLERKLNLDKLQNHSFFPLLIGMTFAFGWSPCIGPILGSVLAIAINDSINGTVLLTVYSIGLGVPFLVVGLMMGKLMLLSKNLAKFSRYFQVITGLILLATGILILNRTIQSLGFQLNSILPSLEMMLIE